jgi:hypothetical protein
MKPKIQLNPQDQNIEILVQDINRRIEDLKLQFNLFFSGELRVPPEKEREDLEKRIRNMISSSFRSARINLMVQNLSSRFSLFNNMWMKRLNDRELGVSTIPKAKNKPSPEVPAPAQEPPKKPAVEEKILNVSLNSEESFDKFFDNYSHLLKKETKTPPDKEKVINSIKSRLITSNWIDAKVSLSVEDGKLKIKIKGLQQ